VPRRVNKARPRRERPGVMSFDLLELAPVVDAVLEKDRKRDPGRNRANVIRELLMEALRARGEIR